MTTVPSTSRSPRLVAILDAGIRVLARGGLRGLTHRAVDAEAGIPEGSTSGYMRTRNALVVGVAERVMEQLEGVIGHVGGQLREGVPPEAVVAGTTEVFVGWINQPELLLARSEISNEATRNPEIAAIMTPGRRRAEEHIAVILEQFGSKDAAAESRVALCAWEGVLQASLIRPVEEREEYFRSGSSMLFSAFGVAADQA